MNNYFRPAQTPVARKPHRCIACYHMVEPGEKHVYQSGFFEGRAFSNRYHEECWQALVADGDFEFTPGELEPPERLKAAQAQAKGEG